MRKFAAHYLLTDNGLLLKNGIAVVNNNKTFQFIETKGELVEVEQMIFHSGLMMGAFEFIKQHGLNSFHDTEPQLSLFDSILNKEYLSFMEVIDLARQLQDSFPDRNIPDLLNAIEHTLLSNAFVKKNIPALYLLSGLELKTLRFTERTRLKKVI